ncbi:MAG: hypothetical protein Q9195_007511 [Heterodermia aff. obscurata]
MAPEKRKRATESDNVRPEKKSKPLKPKADSELIVPREEPAFQRGGASILTPLEKKQIHLQATRDALFEQNTGQKAKNPEFEDDENEDDVDIDGGRAPAKPKANTKAKRKRPKGAEKKDPPGLRIEGLSYKRLVPGSMVLGQVSQINRNDIAIALPNNLTGFVPLTSISDKFTEQTEALVARDDGSEDAHDIEEIDLHLYFSMGQYLRAYVVASVEDSATGVKGKRHIELSVNPRLANSGLTKADLLAGSMLQASVTSVEDHGLVMNLGLEDPAVRGFIPSKQIGKGISEVKPGAVFLTLVTKQKSNSNIFNLCADPQVAGDIKKHNFLTDAPSVDAFLPGTAIEILLSEVSPSGLTGKVMGLLDVTADLIHSGAAASDKEITSRYTVGSKIKGRVICTFPTSEEKKLGISLLDHIISLRLKTAISETENNVQPLRLLPLSKIVAEAKVVKVAPGLGLFLDVGVKGIYGFAHISKIADKKIDSLSETMGVFKLGSTHKARVIGYNAMDGLFIISMEEKVINQPFLRVEDVEVGQIVKGAIDKIIVGEKGVSGLLVKISEGISGLVPDTHFADIRLQNPEKKFKEGMKVTARVLSTNVEKRQIRLTLKKALVNSDLGIWKSYDDLIPGRQALGTIVNVLSSGAVVQFYGSVKGFMPVSEMSESYIDDPKQHFRNGQVVTVHVVSVDPSESRLMVSCKDPTAFTTAQQEALRSLEPGSFVTGIVTEKINDEIVLELDGSRLKALLHAEQLVDGSAQKSLSSFKRIRVGQAMKDVLVLSRQEAKRLIKLTCKPSLVKASKEGILLSSFKSIIEGTEVHGFVNNVTATAVFVQFFGEMIGLLPRSQLPDEVARLPGFGLRPGESITSRILSIDYQQQRFSLTKKPPSIETGKKPEEVGKSDSLSRALSNPVDEISKTLDDYSFGKLTKARINSIKDTQLNVQLAEAVQGRVDISEIFDEWAEIHDKKHPLRSFRKHAVIPVRILGMHDSRNHRFLPITHRDKAPVFELTAKPKSQQGELDVLTLDKVQHDTEYIVYVNNVANDHVWVNLSPNVRGRIKSMDISDNVALVQDLNKNFPVGCAIRAKTIHIDIENNRLDLSARKGSTSKTLTFDGLSPGMVLPGTITKVTERQVLVQLSDNVAGPVHLVDLADDYSVANPTIYQKYQTIRVCVKTVDRPNKRVTLSTRPSKVLSSSLPILDPDISSISQLKVNDIYRGFITNVADNGVFVSLASNITAYIKITDLSDSFLKDWKAGFEIDQLVRGKIIAVDTNLNQVQMSLRESHINNEYKAPLTMGDMKVGHAVTGKVRKVVEYGVFIVVDNTANISGLCHRSEMSDQKGANPLKLYEEGDHVKAVILKVDSTSRKISFGLKASYFAKDDKDEEMHSSDDQSFSGFNDDESNEGSGTEDALLDKVLNSNGDMNLTAEDQGGVQLGATQNNDSSLPTAVTGLSVGFDWTGGTLTEADKDASPSDTDSDASQPRKKRRKKAKIKIDRTGDLDANGPQSIADFERLLLGQPNSSVLWLSYMAFQLELSEVGKAREIAERALKTIHMREQEEKLNVWVALLNLENTYGDEESLDDVFKRACQYNESQEMHERLLSIYIQSGSNEKADELFQATLKKHSQTPSLYLNYATFLMTTLDEGARARALLPRALQSLPPHTHLDTTSKFAQLEFTSSHGEPERGRTMFEGLLSTWPKRLDQWNILLDLELQHGEGSEKKERIRGLFERMVRCKLNARKAKWVFKRWLQFEEQEGDGKSQERVQAKAAEFVKKLENDKAEKGSE